MSGNGLGPYWFPRPIRETLTKVSSLFFDEANWDKHDEGYKRKFPPRSVCDREMLKASLRDSSKVTSTSKVLLCVFLSLLFWFLCRLFGWISWHFSGLTLSDITLKIKRLFSRTKNK